MLVYLEDFNYVYIQESWAAAEDVASDEASCHKQPVLRSEAEELLAYSR